MSMGPDGGCGVPVDGWGVVVAGRGEGEGAGEEEEEEEDEDEEDEDEEEEEEEEGEDLVSGIAVEPSCGGTML
jgi:hypothetical protein